MAGAVVSFLTRLGLVAEEMSKPRAIHGPARVLLSLIAVAFSYFFIHISFFGPPIQEIFKGTYLLGVAVLSILVFKGRARPLREGVVWLDEIINLLSIMFMAAFLAIWAYWGLIDRTELWRDISGGEFLAAAIVGALAGAALYGWEATRPRIRENPVLSDWLFLVSAVSSIGWWGISNQELAARVGSPVPVEVVFFSGMLAAVSFDIARRIVGPVIPLIGLVFLVYSFAPIAQISPGVFQHQGYGLARVMEFLMLETDGMTGLIIEVFATYVVIFVIVGAFLEKTGLGVLFIDATYRLTGRRTGGPGLTSVISSGMFGMISGSGVANVVTTGTFTIPLMKRVGYRPEFAGAVEAAASTGGSYMPPIMGAGAFLLAQLTETSYFHVIKIALIPALLYYLSVACIVYMRAVRQGLHGVPVEELPAWSTITPRLHLLLPIPVMVYYLVIGDSAFLAAVKTIFLIVMLKTADLLAAVQTRWSHRTGRRYFAVAVAFGVFAYIFGLKVGAPFAWFADTLRGLNMGDALFWAVAAFLFLKLGEIIAAAMLPTTTGRDLAREEPPVSGPALFRQLRDAAVELVRCVWASLEAGATNTLIIGCIAGVLGILLSSATQSDLPGRISSVLINFSFGLLPLTILWVIVAGYVVGMGLPITASYVILIIFSAAALTNLGVPTLTAHLICYWVAVTSAVTPPVALASLAASAIAGGDPMKTSIESVKLASWIFVMPFLFVYTPLLLNGTTVDITATVVACLIGIVAWAGFLEGFLVKTTNAVERILLAGAAACLMLPIDHLFTYLTRFEGEYHYHAYAIGVVMIGAVLMLQLARRQPAARTRPA
jgi:TRAP transporter 4TM/12TM fusion protein